MERLFRKYYKRKLKVFIDQSESEPGIPVGEFIRKHLKDSESLVVICTESSKEKEWLELEIKWFEQFCPGRKIFPVVFGGYRDSVGARDPLPPALEGRSMEDKVIPIHFSPRRYRFDAWFPSTGNQLIHLAEALEGSRSKDSDKRLNQRYLRTRLKQTATYLTLGILVGLALHLGSGPSKVIPNVANPCLAAVHLHDLEALDANCFKRAKPDALFEALAAAVTNCWHEGVDKLLDRGADINHRPPRSSTVLHLAARSCDEDMMELLLARGARVGVPEYVSDEVPLHVAARRGEPRLVGLLLQDGADPQAKTRRWVRPLHLAAEQGDASTVRRFLAGGAVVSARDKSGRTPLHCAAASGRPDAVKVLLAHGAAIDPVSNAYRTPLMEATDHGHADCVDGLLTQGADVGFSGRGFTALHLAARNGDTR
ncbi:MAG: ankyrin repeat domain-containing protein, partial [Verrucomicrobiota bacterium]